MTKRYLVTGCAGFIASRVCALLLEKGDLVVGVDNLNDAYDTRLKQWRLATLKSHEGFRFLETDITDQTTMRRLFETDAEPRGPGGPSQPPYAAVINLAARAGVRPSVENPWIYYQANCNGTLSLLEFCRQFGVEKLVLASTSSLYGGDNPVPYREDADTNRPLSPYAASKKAAEALAYTYHHLHGIDVSMLRYFTVYGPAGRPDMSVFRFIRRIAEGEPILVFGDGSQSRDFTYVDDIARGTIAALRPLGYEAINLGGDRPVKLSEIIEQIAELVGRPVQIEYQPAHPADVPATWADISKAARLLDWSPQVSVEEGLRRSVDWYRANRDMALPLELGDR
ncbi:MAG: GDP-mannose 4,6-dehydratase [Candidatus Nealsonbacteria bacterium]|nr:GDP-mannose 4,6-dehydratase [Candidatus Nealsonbacteria bacterium]